MPARRSAHGLPAEGALLGHTYQLASGTTPGSSPIRITTMRLAGDAGQQRYTAQHRGDY